MNYRVVVFLKEEVPDLQGETLLDALQAFGLQDLRSVRVGKCIELEVESGDKSKAQQVAREACERLLVNKKIEDYEFIDDEGESG